MVGPFPLPKRPAVGGIEAVALNLVHALTDLDIDVSVITCSPEVSRTERGVSEGYDYCILPMSIRRARVTYFALERHAVTAAVAAIRPHLVHIQGTNFYGPAGQAARLPTLVTPHGLLRREAGLTHAASGRIERGSKRLRGLARFERITIERATDLVIISPYVGDALRDLTRAHFHEIPNPLPAQFYNVTNQPESGRVLFVGSIDPRKNVLLLVNAFSPVLRICPDARLRIVGKPLDREYHKAVLAAIANPSLLGRVTYLGVLSEHDLLKEYERAALLVLPSKEESSPMAIQQAMAVGLPVVATRAGGVDRLMQGGETGLLVAPDDEATLARAIVELLTDPERCRVMGLRAKASAERFQPAVVASATVSVYREMLR